MANDLQTQKGHPKGLYVLFFTEMWERFSYYGMRAIFTLYMVQALLLNKETASNIYGSYTGLVYLTPLLGGYVADRYWGNRKSIFWGGLIMALGQFFMFLSGTFYTEVGLATTLMYTGLGALIFGNGFFKPNISTMVGQLYPEGDRRIDGAYTIFYMGINLGAMFSPLVAGGLGNTGDPADFKWGFLAACIGMLIGTTLFEVFKNKYVVDSHGNPVGGIPKREKVNTATKVKIDPKDFMLPVGVLAITFVIFYYIMHLDLIGSFIFAASIASPISFLTDKKSTREEKERMIAIFIMAFFVIFFWAAFEQAGASLTFFADEQTDRFIFGMEVPASAFQSVNAAFIVIFAPIFVILWEYFGKRKLEPNSPLKMSIGLVMLSLGYLIIAFGVKDIDPGIKVSMLWLVTMYLMHTWGELCLSPIGLSMVNKLAPVHLASMLMGVWFLSTAAANKFAGTLSSFYPEGGAVKHFAGYQIATLYDFFMLFFFISLASGIILFFINKYLLKLMHGKR